MPIVTLTDLTVKNLKPQSGTRVTYFDKSLKGFGVRVSASGHASYVLVVGANRQRVKLGEVGIVRLAEARVAAKNLLAERQLGTHRQLSSPTYKTALDDFLAEKEKSCRPSTMRGYRQLLTRHGFGLTKLKDITPRDIQNKLDGLKATPGERRHAYAYFQVFFRFCFRRHYVDRSPMERMQPPGGERSRERVLNHSEIKAVWDASEGRLGGIVKLCLLAGLRRSEAAAIQLSWMDGDLLTIPASVAKNRIAHTIPLTPMALAVVNDHRSDSSYLFPAQKLWRGKATWYNAWGKDKPKIDKAAGVMAWVLHDLRRTFATLHASIGTPPHIIERLLNHTTGQIRGVALTYNRFQYLDEMRTAQTNLETFLQTILKTSTAE